MKKRLIGAALLAGVATIALAATSPDRLKNTVFVGDGAAGTKSLSFDIGGSNPLIESVSGVLKISTNGTNLMSVPAATDTFVGLATTDVLTNKTLTLPTIGATGETFNGSSSGTTILKAAAAAGSGTLTLPASATDTLVGKATTDTISNKTIDATTGLGFNGSSSGTVLVKATAAAGSGTLTLPNATDTLVGLATTDTLTNKTLTSPKLNENVAVTTTATKLNYITSAGGTTGTTSANIVFSTSPTIATPALTGAWTTTGDLSETKSGTVHNILNNSASTGDNVLTIESGNGTTSTNNQYIDFLDNDSSQVEWYVGHVGSNDLSFYNATAGANKATLDNIGDLTLAGGLTLGSGFQDVAWTPVMTATTPGTQATTSNTGKYTRVGKMLFADFTLTYAKGSASGNLTVTGFPTAASSDTNYHSYGICYQNSTGGYIAWRINPGSAVIGIEKSTTTAWTAADLGASVIVACNLSFRTD